MATPKKTNKIRDYDRTRKRLLELVGEILTESGFQDLRTNHIAKRLGKDKNLIRYYFQSLCNLKKTFILENDHWTTFCRKLELPDPPDQQQTVEVFKNLVHEHFAFFTENKETQKVMLWQLTEKHPVLQAIGALRMTESRRLLKTASPFLASEAHFRMVMDLVFGGLYFLALISASGNGSLWGVDVNLEKDRAALLDVIDQLMDWAWTYKGTVNT